MAFHAPLLTTLHHLLPLLAISFVDLRLVQWSVSAFQWVPYPHKKTSHAPKMHQSRSNHARNPPQVIKSARNPAFSRTHEHNSSSIRRNQITWSAIKSRAKGITLSTVGDKIGVHKKSVYQITPIRLYRARAKPNLSNHRARYTSCARELNESSSGKISRTREENVDKKDKKKDLGRNGSSMT